MDDDIVRTPWKLGDVLMKLYEIRNTVNDKVYVGITRSSLDQRMRSHKCSSKTKTTPLYCSIRKHGFDKFYMTEVAVFENTKQLEDAENALIFFYRNSGVVCYNILDGGAAYFPIKDMEAHRKNLCAKRIGRRPALGMTHTEENKKLFSEFGKARWDKYGRYPDDVILLSFKDAKEKHGISRTHYHRLKKLAKNNDLS